MKTLDDWKKYNKQILKNKIICCFFGKKFLIKKSYFQMMNEKLDLKNCISLSEKMQLLKLESNKLYSIICDKEKMRNYVTEKLGTDKYLVPIYFSKKVIKSEDLVHLPQNFILKTNNGSGTNWIVINKNKYDLNEICDYMNYCAGLKYGYIHGEFFYNRMEPKIIAEKLLTTNSKELYDYKIHCFNGKEKFIAVTYETNEGVKKTIYDENWKKSNLSFNIPNGNLDIPRPDKLKEMLEIADILSKGFEFLRVDLYYFKEKIYIGELTTFPGAGYLKFNPSDKNVYYGNLLD